MNKSLFVLSFGLSAMILAADHAAAQSGPCGDHAAITESLARAYDETLQSIGFAANNAVIEIFASEAGTWTITVTTAGGPTCLVAAGTAFEAVNSPAPDKSQGA